MESWTKKLFTAFWITWLLLVLNYILIYCAYHFLPHIPISFYWDKKLFYFDTILQSLLLYWLLLAQGYFYVSYITEEREHWYGNRRNPNSCSQLLWLLFTPKLFSITSRSNFYFPLFLYTFLPVFSIFEETNFQFSFLIGYFVIGLQFTYFDKIEVLSRVTDKLVNTSLWIHFSSKELLGLFTTILFSIYIAFQTIFEWIEEITLTNLFYTLFGYFIALVILLCIWRKKCSKENYFVHVHHYILAVICIPLLQCSTYQTCSTMVCLGTLLGIHVEGVARWEMDPLFIQKQQQHLIEG